jgi:hypothetical protein
MSDGDVVNAKKFALGGYFHLLQTPFAPPRQKNIVRIHRFDLASQQVQRRRHIGRCLCGSSEDDENQCNMLVMHCAINSLIGGMKS